MSAKKPPHRPPGSSYVPRVGPVVDVSYLAQRWHRSRNSTNKLLRRLIDSDLEAGMPPEQEWWVGYPVKGRPNLGAWRLINLLKLKAAHPALFARHYVTKDEYEDLHTRVVRLEEALQMHSQSHQNLASRVRGLESKQGPQAGYSALLSRLERLEAEGRKRTG